MVLLLVIDADQPVVLHSLAAVSSICRRSFLGDLFYARRPCADVICPLTAIKAEPKSQRSVIRTVSVELRGSRRSPNLCEDEIDWLSSCWRPDQDVQGRP